jgi:hydrogenase maturation protein HypF
VGSGAPFIFVNMKITLPKKIPAPVFALGGDLKCQPVFAEGDTAEVLPEIGDLAGPDNQDSLEDLVESLNPAVLICDEHPGYFSTALAERVAAERGIRLVKVQHHRAHIAAVCLENDLYDQPVVGLAFDGTGYGDDGIAWGGEFFSGSVADGFVRRAHFAPVPLPGGDAAVRAPWRIVLALLIERGASEAAIQTWIKHHNVPINDLELFRAGLQAKLAVGRCTSVGRWFDAAAALLGIRLTVDFEAQGAIDTQKLAEQNVHEPAPDDWPFAISDTDPMVVDFPALVELAQRSPADAPGLAYAFHHATAAASVEVAARLAAEAGATGVVFSGGVFFNRLLGSLIEDGLSAAGLSAIKAKSLMPGDTAIALGQVGLVLSGAAR